MKDKITLFDFEDYKVEFEKASNKSLFITAGGGESVLLSEQQIKELKEFLNQIEL